VTKQGILDLKSNPRSESQSDLSSDDFDEGNHAVGIVISSTNAQHFCGNLDFEKGQDITKFEVPCRLLGEERTFAGPRRYVR